MRKMGLSGELADDSRLGVCVYCGREDEVQDDHVIPRALFINKNQSTVVVPSCRACNVRKSKGEDDLRDLLVIDKDSSEHPEARRLLDDVKKSALKGFSPIAEAAARAELEPYRTKAGIYLDDFYMGKFDPQPMTESLNLIVRGLYYEETSAILPPDSPVIVMRIPYEQRPHVYRRFAQLPHPEPRVLGPLVFWWVPYLLEPPTDVSMWLMVFFDQVVFIGGTGSAVPEAAKNDRPRRSAKSERRIDKRLRRAGLDRRAAVDELDIVLPRKPPRENSI